MGLPSRRAHVRPTPAPSAGGTGFRRRIATGAMLAAALLFSALASSGCAGPGDGAGPGAAGSAPGLPVHVDLLRGFEGAPERVVTWARDGDSRRALFVPLSDTVAFDLPAAAGPCRLHFGLSLPDEAGKEAEAGAQAVLLLRAGSSAVPFFRETLTADGGPAVWSDWEIPLVHEVGEGVSLVLHVRPPGEKRGEGVAEGVAEGMAWSNPHLVCRGLEPVLPRRLVVLISVDTLRPDHLSLHGYPRPTSPHLDRFASDALVFEDAFAPSPYTLPSHASMLTGVGVEDHRAGFEYPEAPLPRRAVTLAEMLRKRGFRTVAVTAGGLVGQKFGFDQGFDEWREYRLANLPSVLPAVYAALTESADPTFLFLHTYDVHGPYAQPADHRHFRAGEEEGAAVAAAQDPGTWRRILATPHHRYLELDRFSSVGEVVDAYDSGIRFVDGQLGELFEYLRRAGLYDDALIVVTSDHGESLFERRRYFGHGYSLTDDVLRVPLLIKLPGSAVTGRRRGLVELTDLVPTLLDAIGLPRPDHLAGASLLADGGAARWTVRGASSHTGAVWVRSPGWKVISAGGPVWAEKRFDLFVDAEEHFPVSPRLYSLRDDPGELDNLAGELERYPPEVRDLVREMRSLEPPGRRQGRGELNLGDEVEKTLRALGYLQ